jgi:hypothetical protein
VNPNTSVRLLPRWFLRPLAVAAVATLATAAASTARSSPAELGQLRNPFYVIAYKTIGFKTGRVSAGLSTTYGTSKPCPAGYSLWSGGVSLAQMKYTGSIVASFPGHNDSGQPDWEAVVQNPGLGLGEPGLLSLSVACARLVYEKDRRLGFVRPVTGVSVQVVKRSGHLADQETLVGGVPCNTKPGLPPGRRLVAVGGGFALSGTSSAAPVASFPYGLHGRSDGWQAEVDNRGIGETPGRLTVFVNCARVLRQRGVAPLDYLYTRVVPEHYLLLPGPDVVEHSASCPEYEGEESWAISGGFSLGSNDAASPPHVYESAPSVDGKSWVVGAINPPLAPEVPFDVYAVCLVEVA